MDNIMNQLYCTTDAGSNIVKSVKDMNFDHITCMSHLLNTCVKWCISDTIGRSEIFAYMFQNCRKICKYVKKSGYQAVMNPSLKVYIVARWTSSYDLFHSIHENYQKIIDVLEKENMQQLLTFTKTQLSYIVSFFKVLKQMSEDLQASDAPTIHKVLPTIHYLLNKLCKREENENPIINILKTTLEERIKEKILPKLTDILQKGYVQLKN
jgi:hypothetical protein